MKTKILILIISVLAFSSCQKNKQRDQSRTPFLQVEGRYLYVDEIESIIPKGTTKADSLSLANDYVKKWVIQVLLFDKAENNITNQEEIDELVEDYRNSLIIHQYEQNLVKERLENEYTEEALLAFYNENKDKFRVNSSMIKGIYMKMPLGAPKLKNAQNWMRNFKAKSLENLEKYSLQNATSYEYFGDRWVYLNEVAENLPTEAQNLNIGSNKYIELKDSSFHYMLRILDYVPVGSIEPFEIAKDKIKTILLNTHKIDFIKKFENDLYDKAVRDKDINYFTNEK